MQQPHIYHKLGTSHFFILKVSEEYFFYLRQSLMMSTLLLLKYFDLIFQVFWMTLDDIKLFQYMMRQSRRQAGSKVQPFWWLLLWSFLWRHLMTGRRKSSFVDFRAGLNMNTRSQHCVVMRSSSFQLVNLWLEISAKSNMVSIRFLFGTWHLCSQSVCYLSTAVIAAIFCD